MLWPSGPSLISFLSSLFRTRKHLKSNLSQGTLILRISYPEMIWEIYDMRKLTHREIESLIYSKHGKKKKRIHVHPLQNQACLWEARERIWFYYVCFCESVKTWIIKHPFWDYHGRKVFMYTPLKIPWSAIIRAFPSASFNYLSLSLSYLFSAFSNFFSCRHPNRHQTKRISRKRAPNLRADVEFMSPQRPPVR